MVFWTHNHQFSLTLLPSISSLDRDRIDFSSHMTSLDVLQLIYALAVVWTRLQPCFYMHGFGAHNRLNCVTLAPPISSLDRDKIDFSSPMTLLDVLELIYALAVV